MLGRTYTVSTGKSPCSPVLSQVPEHQPEFKTVSPEFSSSKRIRSPRTRFRNEDPSAGNEIEKALLTRIYEYFRPFRAGIFENYCWGDAHQNEEVEWASGDGVPFGGAPCDPIWIKNDNQEPIRCINRSFPLSTEQILLFPTMWYGSIFWEDGLGIWWVSKYSRHTLAAKEVKNSSVDAIHWRWWTG